MQPQLCSNWLKTTGWLCTWDSWCKQRVTVGFHHVCLSQVPIWCVTYVWNRLLSCKISSKHYVPLSRIKPALQRPLAWVSPWWGQATLELTGGTTHHTHLRPCWGTTTLPWYTSRAMPVRPWWQGNKCSHEGEVKSLCSFPWSSTMYCYSSTSYWLCCKNWSTSAFKGGFSSIEVSR